VAKRRKAILGNSQDSRVVARGGSTYEMDTAKIGGTPTGSSEVENEFPAPQATQTFHSSEDESEALANPDEAALHDGANTSKAHAVEPSLATAQSPKTTFINRFGVLYADPWSAMTLEDLCVQPIPAADDSVLFVRAPRLDDALRLMECWGFTYVDNIVWNKGGSELGYCVRYQHELFLIGTRGAILTPAQGMELRSILCAASGDELANEFAAMFPNLPKVDLFTHTPRAGWDAWHPDDNGDAEAQQVEADLAESVYAWPTSRLPVRCIAVRPPTADRSPHNLDRDELRDLRKLRQEVSGVLSMLPLPPATWITPASRSPGTSAYSPPHWRAGRGGIPGGPAPCRGTHTGRACLRP
jgi:N6-adenosine-specific RNA methylase IME4